MPWQCRIPQSLFQEPEFLQAAHQAESAQGWLSRDVMALFYWLLRDTKTPQILEIGAWKGRSSIILGKIAHQRRGHVISLDPFTGSLEHRHLNIDALEMAENHRRTMRLAELKQTVTTVVGTVSHGLIPESSQFDLIFIDGSHEYQDVALDADFALKTCAPEGWICFHDYKWPGVKKCIWDLLRSADIGPARRVEDTIFFQPHSRDDKGLNAALLKRELARQERKRKRRQRISSS